MAKHFLLRKIPNQKVNNTNDMLHVCDKILKGFEMTDPFAKLIRPKAQFELETKQRLADILEPFVWLDPENDLIAFTEKVKNLTSLQLILIYILARKVISLINQEITASLSPSEIESGTKLPGGTVRPKLGELTKKNIIVRTESGYEIAPTFLISEVEKILK
ncbi:MAG: hypothetical protein KJZ52_05870 [Anaerolineales bacterium]|nr:hypothetical protein [Anaerolineales bacterium]